MSSYPIDKLIKVAELYYYRKMSQKKISNILNVSPASVSRMLEDAINTGLIKFKIEKIISSYHKIERELEKKYKLEKAIVIKSPSNNEERYIKKMLGKTAGELFYKITEPCDKVGIGPGETILEMIGSLDENNTLGLQIIPLMGGWGLNQLKKETNKLVSTLASVLQCDYYLLLAPAIVNSPEVKEILLNEPQIKQIVEMWKDINIAVFSIGPEVEYSIYPTISQGIYNNQNNIKGGAVGDILGRIINEQGEEMELFFNQRMISIPLEQLKKIPKRLGIGGGQHKFRSVKAALDGGLINYLVTDYKTGLYILGKGGN